MITGPTTLMSILNSLQMGFRTLAIEKRSSEVWQVLAAAKTEFHKYGQVWVKLEKQLQTAQNTVAEAGQRNRVIERKLRSVESPSASASVPLDELIDTALSPADELAALDGLDGVGRPAVDPSLVQPEPLSEHGAQTA